MTAIEQHVDRLETALANYMATADGIIRRHDERMERLDQNISRLDQNITRLDQNITRLDRGLEEMKRESREHTLEMARIADRIGRFAEDIVAPNLPRLARETFGIAQVDFSGQRVEKRHAAAPAKFREFDFVLAGQRKLLVNETKSTARLRYFDEFAGVLKEIFAYFPEYKGYSVIPVFASLGLSPDFVRRLTRLKIYALALGDRTMELLNFSEVAAKRNGARPGLVES